MHLFAAKQDPRPRERTAATQYSFGAEAAAWVVALMIVLCTLDRVLEQMDALAREALSLRMPERERRVIFFRSIWRITGEDDLNILRDMLF